MSQLPRHTQRVPRSCIECARRKVKCNKRIPCEPCVKRGDALSCMREVVRVNGKTIVALDIDPTPANLQDAFHQMKDENEELRRRLQQVGADARQKDLASAELTNPNSSPSLHARLPEAVEDIISTFESLHFPGQNRNIVSSGPGPSCVSPNDLMSLLPIRKSSELLVRFSIHNLGWVHCALNAPIFLAQHESFWNALAMKATSALEDPSWLALYFAILAVGIYFMSDEDAKQIHFLHEGLSGLRGPGLLPPTEGFAPVARVWYDTSLQCLNAADFTGQPALSNIQTLAIATLLHRNLGESQRDYILLGLAINSARTIGMDWLGCENDATRTSVSCDLWADRSTRELGRRLWWTLVICDWMKASNRESSIDPRSFNTKLSITTDQSHSEIVLGTSFTTTISENGIPSPLLFHVMAAKLAHVMYWYANSRLEAHMKRVRKGLQHIDILSQNLPPHLVFHSDLGKNQPEWLSLQRRQALFLLQICRIMLCLAALPYIIESNQDEDNIRTCGLGAANKILDARQIDSPSIFDKLWGTTACVSGAGIYLALDLICFRYLKMPEEVRYQTARIRFCIRALQNSHGGSLKLVGILEQLLKLSQSWPTDQPPNKDCLIQIMKLARSPNSTPHFQETSTNLLVSLGSDKASMSSESVTAALAASQSVSYSGDERGLAGLEVDASSAGGAMDLDFMEFVDVNENLPSFSAEWDGNAFFDFFPGQQLY